MPYTEYDFTETNPEGALMVLGWSKDGKILYETSIYNSKDQSFSKDYYLIDLITDEMIFPQWEQHVPDFYTEGSVFTKKFVSDLAKLFTIEAAVINTQEEFPYFENDEKKYTIDISNIEQAFNGNGTWFDIIITQDFFPFNSKNIGRVCVSGTVSPSLTGDWDYYKRVKFYYTKSPFENRIAVIMDFSDIIIDSGETRRQFQVLGCHLGAGFTRKIQIDHIKRTLY
ncbi:MAG: hypothetical protein LBK13_00525 [Spirochaetales bacterium]|jgi:hypothetical protein|nr:hypothetical protein [Spirochaetales bacterium]